MKHLPPQFALILSQQLARASQAIIVSLVSLFANIPNASLICDSSLKQQYFICVGLCIVPPLLFENRNAFFISNVLQ